MSWQQKIETNTEKKENLYVKWKVKIENQNQTKESLIADVAEKLWLDGCSTCECCR